MHKLIHFLRNDRTVRSTSLVVGGHAAANVGAYFYHLFMGRLLVPADYGLLQSLISLSNLLSVPIVTLNTVVVKFISTYVGKEEREKISSLYFQLRRFLFGLLFIGGSIFLLFTKPIMLFLHLDSWLNVIILDLAIFFGLVNFLNRATLQGLALFWPLTITQFIEAFGKLALGVAAVLLGLRVPGAYGAFVLIIFISYIYMVAVLGRKLGKPVFHPLPVRAMTRYAVPSALMTIGVTALYNTDVILVRHFLSAYDAGLYAALSVLGKIIFFGTAPVATTMFPLVSEAHARGEKYHRIFLLSLLFLLSVAGSVTLLFSLAPDFFMRLLIGTQYLDASRFLAPFSMFLSLCSLIFLFVNFFLSIHRTKAVFIVLGGAIVQAGLLFVYHSSIMTVITISLVVTTVVSVLLCLYYLYLYVTRS